MEDTANLQNLFDFPTAENNDLLCIESIIFKFAPDLSERKEKDFDNDGYQYFTMYIRGIPIILHIIDSNELLTASYTDEKHMSLLLARNVQGGWAKHFFVDD